MAACRQDGVGPDLFEAARDAVRRIIDNGFSGKDINFINDYFSMMIIIALVLAIASAARYYFVIWLGERVIISDVRADVFAHITSLSPEFFDNRNWRLRGYLYRWRDARTIPPAAASMANGH